MSGKIRLPQAKAKVVELLKLPYETEEQRKQLLAMNNGQFDTVQENEERKELTFMRFAKVR